MQVWIDADACPKAVREIILRACRKRRVPVTLVADRYLHIKASKLVRAIQVPRGQDAADDQIASMMAKDDVVITGDIPLASRVVELGGTALNPRGELYTEANVRERLSIRDFAQDLRDFGVDTGGPKPYTERDRKRFADAFDRTLTQQLARSRADQ